MTIKYIVKSENQQGHYLVNDAAVYNRIVPFAFKPCHGQVYPAMFDTKDDAVAACEEAAKYHGGDWLPVILETIQE